MISDTLTFANPRLLWLLLPVLLLAAWAGLQHAATQRLLGRLLSAPMVKRLASSWSPRRSLARLGLWTLAALLLVAAAARPRYGLRETEVSNAGIDIAVVVDASKSMLAKDVVPNRLQGTVLEISALLDKLAGGRVALIPFAGIPFVQCPLTADHDVIRMYMTDLKPEDLPVGGTNIGRAIGLAVETLTGEHEKAEAEARDNLIPQFRGSKNKAIVLFSDGEDHEGAAVEAAQKAAEKGVRIFAVGVGTASGNPVPILGPDGASIGSQKDENGNLVFSALNMELLEKIATTTGGKAFHYDRQSIAGQVFQNLDALEKAEYQAQFQQLGEDRFQYLLGPALLLLLGEWLLGSRRRERKRALALAALLMALLTVAVPRPVAALPSWLQRENPDVREGREKLAEHKAGEAVKAFQTAQATRPEHAILWYGLGVAEASLGARQEAVTALSRALGAVRDRDAALEADIPYALGTTQLQWGNELARTAQKAAPPKEDAAKDPGDPKAEAAATATEDPLPHFREAVKALESALLADPARKETRRNLELARLAAFPPCRARDKANEPNDLPAQAAALTFAADQREQTLDLRACPEDRDLFRVELQPGDRFSASIKTKVDASPAAEPDDPHGGATPAQLGVWLLAADGQTVLRGPPEGKAPLEAVDLGRVAAPAPVLVDVRNIAEVEATYDLTLKLLPACARIEDHFEPNDTFLTARTVTLGEPLNGRLCPLNDDHFAVDLQPGQGLLVKAKTKIDAGADAVVLNILGPDGVVLATGRKAEEGQAVRLARALVAGRYVVQVHGGLDTEADYEAQIAVLPPCQLRDDPWEDNDQAVQANPLAPESLQAPLQNLQLCPGDDDWFAVELRAGESLFVDLTADVKELPDAADLAGALTVEVWDEKGQLWSQAIGGPSGGESVSRTAVVLAPPAGTYRLRVTGGGVAPPHFPLPPLPPGAIVSAPTVQPTPPPGPQLPAPPGTLPPHIQAVPMAPGLPPHAGMAPPGGQAQPPGQPPPPPPIAHVLLPPGLPTPAIDERAARLDLPYTLKVRILPPCPAGNDELEPNDSAAAAKDLELGAEKLMRICKGDEDWLAIHQKAVQNLQITARYDLSLGPVDLELFDETGKTSLAKGERHGAEGKKSLAPMDDSPAARKGRTAVTGLAVQGEKKDRTIKLRASAAKDVENFYMLQIQEPPPPSDKPNPQEQSDKDKAEEDKEKQEDEKQKQDEKAKQEPPPDQKALQDQMQRADHNPTNLEAEEALRKSPFKNQTPAKDW